MVPIENVVGVAQVLADAIMPGISHQAAETAVLQERIAAQKTQMAIQCEKLDWLNIQLEQMRDRVVILERRSVTAEAQSVAPAPNGTEPTPTTTDPFFQLLDQA